LHEKDGQEGPYSEQEAVGDEEASGSCGGGCCPVKIEGMKEAADCEEDEEQQKLGGDGENCLHVLVP